MSELESICSREVLQRFGLHLPVIFKRRSSTSIFMSNTLSLHWNPPRKRPGVSATSRRLISSIKARASKDFSEEGKVVFDCWVTVEGTLSVLDVFCFFLPGGFAGRATNLYWVWYLQEIHIYHSELIIYLEQDSVEEWDWRLIALQVSIYGLTFLKADWLKFSI